MRASCGVLAAAAVLLGAAPARAQVSCTASATPVVFGSYVMASAAATDSVGEVSIDCTGPPGTGPIDLTIALSAGSSRTVALRGMRRAEGGATLAYNLYTNAARSVVWGDGVTGAVVPLRVSRNGRTESRPVYARIPPRQAVAPGAYVDAVVITFTY